MIVGGFKLTRYEKIKSWSEKWLDNPLVLIGLYLAFGAVIQFAWKGDWFYFIFIAALLAICLFYQLKTRYKKLKSRSQKMKEEFKVKTIKEFNKELNAKAWYRLIKVLWVLTYIIWFFLCLKVVNDNPHKGNPILFFLIFAVSYLGVTAALRKTIYYATDYISTGRLALKEKWYFLLLTVLYAVPSIIAFIELVDEVFFSNGRRMR